MNENTIPAEPGLWWIRRGDSVRIAAFSYLPRVIGQNPPFPELCCAAELYMAEDGFVVNLEFPTDRKERSMVPMKCDVAVRKTPRDMFYEGVQFLGPAVPHAAEAMQDG